MSDGRWRARPVTMQDVAAHAGVSSGTVSNVLADRDVVATETRERVLQSVAALGYRPNRVARSLLLRRTHMLGMVVPDLANPFFAELVRGVETAAQEQGHCVVVGSTENDEERESTFLRDLIDRGVDGALVSVAADGQRLTETVGDLPIVAVDRVPAGWPGASVVTDDREAMHLAVDHLVGLGHRRVGFVGHQPGIPSSRARSTACRDALVHHGLSLAFEAPGLFTLEAGRKCGAQLFRLPEEERPTAVVAANDLLAIGLLEAARDSAVRIPEDLSVVGYDDIQFAALTTPPLTTVAQPVRELGREATMLLLHAVDHVEASQDTVRLHPTLSVRQSTAAPGK